MDRRTFIGLAMTGIAGMAAFKPLALPKSAVAATTWFPKDFDCPVCKTKNTFQVWGSYGSYIYQWPSKYQWVFWPWTDSPSVYLCKKCHVATFLDDYEDLPKDKLAVLEKELAKIPFNRKFKDYMEVPMSERLEMAERVYRFLPDRGDVFWSHMYRVQGYHYGKDQPEKAVAVRTKALELTKKMMTDRTTSTPMKELLYISGAMKHFLKDDKGAVEDFKKGLATKFAALELKADELKNAEEGMNERFDDYIKQIASSKPPRSSDPES
ncbi:MAG: hypothetical protein IT173_12910 [Acidobacteria bacterium]|nr:hypothetical protein [Acidobacteriota bacterium]